MIVLGIWPARTAAEKKIACFAGTGQSFLNERALCLGRRNTRKGRAVRR